MHLCVMCVCHVSFSLCEVLLSFILFFLGDSGTALLEDLIRAGLVTPLAIAPIKLLKGSLALMQANF